MNHLGLFRKESHTHFVRDPDTGEVTEVIRSGDTPKKGWFSSKTPTSDALEKQYYKSHPEEHHKTRKKIAKFASKMDQKVVKYNRTRNPIGGFGRPYSTQGNYNPFGGMFDTGLKPMQKPKPRKKGGGKTKFVIRDGKAYPVVGTGKKSRKNKRKKQSQKKKTGGGSLGWDMGDWSW